MPRFRNPSRGTLVLGATMLIACKAQTYAPGPAIGAPTLVAASLPSDQPIQIAFDRFLNPATITAQAITITDSKGALLEETLAYDPVTLTVTLTSAAPASAWITAGQTYNVAINLGLEAIDGATLATAATLPLTVTAASGASGDPAMHFCVDVLPIFQSKCAYGPCHVTPQNMGASVRFPDGNSAPAAGLILDSSEGIASTAVNRVSHGSNTGGLAGAGGPPSFPFGIDMSLIDPGQPGNSWLMYKTLLAIPATPDEGLQGVCGPYTTASSFASSDTSPVTPDERARLSNYILGREMPYPTTPSEPEPSTNPGDLTLSVQELERVRAWIAQGATVEDCTLCSAASGAAQ